MPDTTAIKQPLPKETPIIPYQFKPGESGNLAGRPKGSVSIRDAVRKYLDDNPEEFGKMVRDFVRDKPSFTWSMLEPTPPKDVRVGNPDGTSIGEPSGLLKELTKKLNELHGEYEKEKAPGLEQGQKEHLVDG